jgi:hypothetical protein
MFWERTSYTLTCVGRSGRGRILIPRIPVRFGATAYNCGLEVEKAAGTQLQAEHALTR